MSHDNNLLVISCEHASANVPADYHAIFFDQPNILSTHTAVDIGAITVAKQCAILAGFACYAKVTRLLIDLNRSLTHRAVFSKFSRRLTPADRDNLVENYYLPYRQNLLKHIQQVILQHKKVVHISVHSFTPLWQDKLRTADVGLLYDPKRLSEVAWVKQWQTKLQSLAPTWRIRRNYPYRGVSDGVTSWLRQEFPVDRYIGIELEINQALLQGEVATQDVAALIYQSLIASRGEEVSRVVS